MDQGLFVVEASRSHSDSLQSVGLLWTSDQPDEETSTWQHTTLQGTDIHVPGGARIRNPSKRAATDPRLRPHGHQDRQTMSIFPVIFNRERIYRPRQIWIMPVLTYTFSQQSSLLGQSHDVVNQTVILCHFQYDK